MTAQIFAVTPLQDIPAGEELCYDYCWALRELAHKHMACRCGAGARCCSDMFGSAANGQIGEQQPANAAAAS